MTRKLYPIGIQTFSEIRTNDNLYIDKTAYIYRMANHIASQPKVGMVVGLFYQLTAYSMLLGIY